MLAMSGWSNGLLAAVMVLAAALLSWLLRGQRRDTWDDIHRPRLPRGERRRVRARLNRVVS